MNIDATIIGALIGAVALIVATFLTIAFNRKKESGLKNHIGSVNSGRDSYVASGDVTVNQTLQGNRLISKECSSLITNISLKEIDNEDVRLKWNAFDVRFISKCVIDTHRGFAFDGDAFQDFKTADNDKYFGYSAVIYAKCCIELNDEENEDWLACNRLAQIYTNARLALRGQLS